MRFSFLSILPLLLAQPCLADPAPNIQPGKVLILPFTQLNGDSSQHFISQALHQVLLNQLSRASSLHATELATTQPAENLTHQSAMQLGLSQGAEYIITGSYQFAGPDLRITGSILSTGSGATIASLRATGPQRDLFSLEDIIADQAKRALIPPAPVATASPALPAQQQSPSTPDAFQGSLLQASLMTGKTYNRENFNNDYNRYYFQPYPTPFYYGYPYTFPYYGGTYYTPFSYGYTSPPYAGVYQAIPGTIRTR